MTKKKGNSKKTASAKPDKHSTAHKVAHKKPHVQLHHKPIGLKKEKYKKFSTDNILTAITVVVVIAIIALLVWKGPQIIRTDEKPTSDVVATVNGEEITQSYVDEQFDNIPAMYKSFVTKEMILNQTINEALLLQEADKQGIKVTEEDVENVLNQVMNQSGLGPEEFELRLSEQNMTLDFIKELYRRQLTISHLLNQTVLKGVKFDDAELKAEYDKIMRARHILVNTSEEAEAVIAKLEKGLDFAELAKEFSVGPSGPKGGELGEFEPGQMVPEFEQAVQALKPGEFTTEPVKTQFGFHVILREPLNETFQEKKDSIEAGLLQQKQQTEIPAYIKKLRSGAEIVVIGLNEEAPVAK